MKKILLKMNEFFKAYQSGLSIAIFGSILIFTTGATKSELVENHSSETAEIRRIGAKVLVTFEDVEGHSYIIFEKINRDGVNLISAVHNENCDCKRE